MKERKYEGFSLIEILVVVALIIILATITIVAINPGKNFRDPRNAQRSADVNAILSAVSQYVTDGKDLPAILPCVGDGGVAQASHIGTGGVDLGLILTGTTEGNDYMVSIPMDPSSGTAEDTGYTICTMGTRVQIGATREGTGDPIVVRR